MCVLTKEVSPIFSGGTVDTGSLCDAARAAYALLMTAHPELTGTPDADCWIERAAAVSGAQCGVRALYLRPAIRAA